VLASVASGAYRLRRAQTALEEADLELANAAAQAAELARLRQSRERVSPRERPKQDVIALMNGVMAEAGIPSERLKNLENESSESFSSSASGASSPGRYRRQSVSVNFEQLAPEHIGKLLLELRHRQGVWTPTRLELSHARTQPDSGNLYSLRLLISATYLSDELSARSR
jgi:hypothetical protein